MRPRRAQHCCARTSRPDLSVAVVWGVTVATVARSLSPGVVPGLQIVQMSGTGNTFSSGAEYASGTLGRFGAAFGARVHHFPVPDFFDLPATHAAVWSERSVQRVLRLQQRANVAVFSVGALGGRVPGHLYRSGYLQREDLRALAHQGVVGDLGTVFLRADGDSESLPINSRSSGLPIEALKLIPKRICVALGGAKAPVIRAALLAGRDHRPGRRRRGRRTTYPRRVTPFGLNGISRRLAWTAFPVHARHRRRGSVIRIVSR